MDRKWKWLLVMRSEEIISLHHQVSALVVVIVIVSSRWRLLGEVYDGVLGGRFALVHHRFLLLLRFLGVGFYVQIGVNDFLSGLGQILLNKQQCRSAGVAPEVTLRNPLRIGDEAPKQRTHPGSDTQGRCHQKSKPGVLVVPQQKIKTTIS